MIKTEVDSLKKLLKWFVGLTIVILILVVQIAFSNAGFKKVMKSEFKSLSEKFDANILAQKEKEETMQKIIEQTKLQVQDMANQGMVDGWYKPTLVFRNGKIKINE